MRAGSPSQHTGCRFHFLVQENDIAVWSFDGFLLEVSKDDLYVDKWD